MLNNGRGRNILQRENQDIDQLQMKENARVSYAQELIAQIETNRRRKEEEIAFKRREERETYERLERERIELETKGQTKVSAPQRQSQNSQPNISSSQNLVQNYSQNNIHNSNYAPPPSYTSATRTSISENVCSPIDQDTLDTMIRKSESRLQNNEIPSGFQVHSSPPNSYYQAPSQPTSYYQMNHVAPTFTLPDVSPQIDHQLEGLRFSMSALQKDFEKQIMDLRRRTELQTGPRLPTTNSFTHTFPVGLREESQPLPPLSSESEFLPCGRFKRKAKEVIDRIKIDESPLEQAGRWTNNVSSFDRLEPELTGQRMEVAGVTRLDRLLNIL